MGVVVFDADVLIAYLNRDDASHARAVDRMQLALLPGMRRLVSAVNYTEVLIGPLRAAGRAGAETVDAMFVRFGIETITVDMDIARRAADVRNRTGLKLPDAYALATAVHAEQLTQDDVHLESFDERVQKAHGELAQ